MGRWYSGWRNSRCMPRPTKQALSIEPPQLEPSILHQHGLGTKFGMSGKQRLALAAVHQNIRAVLRLDLQGGFVRQILQINAALDLRLGDVVIHFIAQIRMRQKHVRAGYRSFASHC